MSHPEKLRLELYEILPLRKTPRPTRYTTMQWLGSSSVVEPYVPLRLYLNDAVLSAASKTRFGPSSAQICATRDLYHRKGDSRIDDGSHGRRLVVILMLSSSSPSSASLSSPSSSSSITRSSRVVMIFFALIIMKHHHHEHLQHHGRHVHHRSHQA